MDSDLGLDHTAIQHLVGDIADDILGMEGTPWSDFKPVSRKSISGLAKKSRGKKESEYSIQKLSMKGMFWNSNGLRDQAKFRFLFDTIKENQLDFIALLETKRNDFTMSELAHFCANKNYTWNWSPTRGHSEGILLGVNIDNFDVQSVALGNFHVKLHLKNKIDNFEWVLVAVYGDAQNE
jgi:hypothetical protein